MSIEPRWAIVSVVFAISAGAMLLVFFFGRKLYDRHIEMLLDSMLHLYKPNAPDFRAVASIVDAFRAYVESRNDFMATFVQLIIAVMVVAFLIVLLIMEVIQADAALPLIAAVVAYVLGKGAGSTGSSATRPQRGE